MFSLQMYLSILFSLWLTFLWSILWCALEHYVKINCIVLFKYLEAFVALQAIFKMTFKTTCKEDKSNGGKA